MHTRPLIAKYPTRLVDIPQLMRRADRHMEGSEIELSISSATRARRPAFVLPLSLSRFSCFCFV